MMADLPFMPMYVDAMLGDTGHLSNEEFGAYHRLLYAMWRRGGALPDDDGDLMRICCSTPYRWPRLRSRLRPFLSKTETGEWTQKRLKTTMVKSKTMVATNHEKTAKAREAKANKKKWIAGEDRPVTDAYDRRRTASVQPAVTTGKPNPEENKAPPQVAESLILSSPTVDAAALPPRANGHGEGSADVGSLGLEGRSPPQPSEKITGSSPEITAAASTSRHEPVIKASPALLNTPLVKKARTGLMAALDDEEDD